MIINAISGNECLGVLYSGGYDKVLKAWDMNTFQNTASVPIGDIIWSVASGDGQLFISSGGGDIDKFVVK